MGEDTSFDFPPVSNGMDYLVSVVEHLTGKPTNRDLKYAVLHLQAATEVLLKVRLTQEHWSLVFKDPGTAKRKAYDSGDFESCTSGAAVDRLRDVVGINIDDKSKRTLVNLSKRRNALQHFGLGKQSAYAIEAQAAEVLDFLLDFVAQHLAQSLDRPEASRIARSMDEVREGLHHIRSLVSQRMKRLQGELNTLADQTVQCPLCQQWSLTVAQGQEPTAYYCRCLFCQQEWINTYRVAADYVSEILRTPRGTGGKRNDDSHVHWCPGCHESAFIRNAVLLSDKTTSTGLCFNCGERISPDALYDCSCGAPVLMEDPTGQCPECWAEQAEDDEHFASRE